MYKYIAINISTTCQPPGLPQPRQVPNPQECGGSGGCQGATVELGIAWAVQWLGP